MSSSSGPPFTSTIKPYFTECYREPDGVHAAAGRRSRSPHSVYNSLRRIRKALFDCVNRALARRPGPGGM